MTRSRILAVTMLLAFVTIPLRAQHAELTATLRGHTKKIEAIEFSHSGEILAASSKGGTVRIWSTVTGVSLATIAGTWEVFRMDWSDDDRQLAIAYRGEKAWQLVVWDVTAAKSIFSQQVEAIYRFEWSPDGRTFLTLDQRRQVQVWDVKSGHVTQTLRPVFSLYLPRLATFVADGRRILTSSVNEPVQLWDVVTGKLIDSFPANLQKQNYPIPVPQILSLDKRLMFSGNVNVYETATGTLLGPIKGDKNLVSFSPDGKAVLTVGYDVEEKVFHRQSNFSLRRIDNGEELSVFRVPEGVWEIFWSPDGKTLVIDGTFSPRVIDVVSGRENGRLPYGNCRPGTWFGSDGCEPIRFSADGALMLKVKDPIKVWTTTSVSLVEELKAAHVPAAFSPSDSRVLATASADRKSVLLWRVKR